MWTQHEVLRHIYIWTVCVCVCVYVWLCGTFQGGGGVHRGVHQNIDYNFFALSVNSNNNFIEEKQHQQRIV
jgi:hypothetical protein